MLDRKRIIARRKEELRPAEKEIVERARGASALYHGKRKELETMEGQDAG